MTPYRVLAINKNKATPSIVNNTSTFVEQSGAEIYVSMLTKNKSNGKRQIVILHRPWPLGSTVDDAKEIAHKMTTRNNSQFEALYTAEELQMASGRIMYKLISNEFTPSFDGMHEYRYALDGKFYTLHDCLVAAMHHFLGQNDLPIVTEL